MAFATCTTCGERIEFSVDRKGDVEECPACGELIRLRYQQEWKAQEKSERPSQPSWTVVIGTLASAILFTGSVFVCSSWPVPQVKIVEVSVNRWTNPGGVEVANIQATIENTGKIPVRAIDVAVSAQGFFGDMKFEDVLYAVPDTDPGILPGEKFTTPPGTVFVPLVYGEYVQLKVLQASESSGL